MNCIWTYTLCKKLKSILALWERQTTLKATNLNPQKIMKITQIIDSELLA
jgi:hypothetical protein